MSTIIKSVRFTNNDLVSHIPTRKEYEDLKLIHVLWTQTEDEIKALKEVTQLKTEYSLLGKEGLETKFSNLSEASTYLTQKIASLQNTLDRAPRKANRLVLKILQKDLKARKEQYKETHKRRSFFESIEVVIDHPNPNFS